MAKLGGYNPKGHSGKYSGKAGRNSGRNPQPGYGGSGGGGGNKGCGGKKRIVPALIILSATLLGIPAAGIWAVSSWLG